MLERRDWLDFALSLMFSAVLQARSLRRLQHPVWGRGPWPHPTVSVCLWGDVILLGTIFVACGDSVESQGSVIIVGAAGGLHIRQSKGI